MKVAFLSSIYPKHADLIYRENPSLKYRPSNEQMDFIRWHALSSYVKWNNYLQSKSCEIVQFHHNLPYVELKWAEENQFCPKKDNEIFQIGIEKIKRFKPDILYCSSPLFYTRSNFLNILINHLPKKPKLVAWYGANCGDEKIFSFFDLTLSNSKHLVNSLRQKKINSDHLRHSFDPIILEKIGPTEKSMNRLGFFGNLCVTNDFNQRTKILREISYKTKILDVYGEIEKPCFMARSKYFCLESRQKLSKVASSLLPSNSLRYWSDKKNLPPNPWQIEKNFSSSIKEPLYGHQMLKKLASYQVAFNFHNRHTEDSACNMRLFEVTGVGCCLLTDYKSDIHKIFEPDSEIVTYSSPEEAISKAKYLMAEPKSAQEIALAGQKRTLSDYTAEKQVDHLVYHLNNLWN